MIYTANSGRISYNIYRITGTDSHLKLYGEHYDTAFSEINVYKGHGVFKNGILSLAFTSTKESRQRISVVTVKIENRHVGEYSLSGLFADLDEQKGDFQRLFYGIALVEPYKISRFRISRGRQFSRLWRKSYFKNVEEIRAMVEPESTSPAWSR